MCALLMGLIFVFLLHPISVSAMASGSCSNCHTMHNSQGGQANTFDSSATPNADLVKGTCTGCHAQHSESNVVTIDISRIPQVYHTNATDLAGGNFSYINGTKGSGSSVAKGHNVHFAISALDADDILSAPPGDEFTTGITNNNFTCAGQYGCHGDRANATSELSAVKGAHHANDSTINGTTLGTSYRFLKGVKGVENNATYGWQNYSATYTNKYKGVNGPDADASKTSPGTNGTISGFCSECHGKFHGSGSNGHGTSSAWLRHPTDILLPNSGAYAAYNPLTAYDATVPVAFTNPASPTRATSVVACLSCHGVHGTDYPDILRWDYSTMNAGNGGAASGTGCFKCHSDKD
jgi:nitrate/TMAO reductase-like tetraheme cytochrome c subunit